MRPLFSTALTLALILAAALDLTAQAPFDPHGDSDSGALRLLDEPRGSCRQCHPSHADSWAVGPNPKLLFTDNDNRLAFHEEGDGPCHSRRPDNYPLDETDRIPDTELDAGYFEANLGGLRRIGVEFRGRWPGEAVFTNSTVTASGQFLSPHAFDPDMPRQDTAGEGLCLNCHDPHGTPNRFDLLLAPYGGIGGHEAVGPPTRYALCFSCHGADGPSGMEVNNRYIADYYDSGLNGEFAGHQIRMNNDVAISWPAHIQPGDMLPCYDCHNPHGSEGNNRVEPNAFLISDQRSGWSGLTDTLNDPEQCRRFCFGCHIPSDGIPGSRTVEGIVMNTIPDEDGHAFTDTQSCYQCHGADYSTPTSYNVHNPGGHEGEESGFGNEGLWGP